MLPKVLSTNPDLVFLDWNTTGELSFDQHILQEFFSILTRLNIVCIFLLLPRLHDKDNYVLDLPSANQIIKLANSPNAHVLDLRFHKLFNPSIHLRDCVHTTSCGASFYSTEIYKFCIDFNLFKSPKRSSLSKLSLSSECVSSLTLFPIHIICRSFSFSIKPLPHAIADQCLLTIDHFIGPFSPQMIELKSQSFSRIFPLKDRWCYFIRHNYTSFELPQLSTHCRLTISASEVMTDTTAPPDFHFSSYPYSSHFFLVKSISSFKHILSSSAVDICFLETFFFYLLNSKIFLRRYFVYLRLRIFYYFR